MGLSVTTCTAASPVPAQINVILLWVRFPFECMNIDPLHAPGNFWKIVETIITLLSLQWTLSNKFKIHLPFVLVSLFLPKLTIKPCCVLAAPGPERKKIYRESFLRLFGWLHILNLPGTTFLLWLRISESSHYCVLEGSEILNFFLCSWGDQKFWIFSCVLGGIRTSEFFPVLLGGPEILNFRLCC